MVVEYSEESRCYFMSLPHEIKVKIFSNLSLNDLNKVQHVCREWYDILTDPITWQETLINEGCIKPGWYLNQIYQSASEWFQLYNFIKPVSGNLLKNVNFEGNSTKGWVSVRGDWILERRSRASGNVLPIENNCSKHIYNITTSDRGFHRAQRIQLWRIPKISELIKRFDVYLNWSVWVTPGPKIGSEYTAYISKEQYMEHSAAPSIMLCESTFAGKNMALRREWEFKSVSVKLDRLDLHRCFYHETGKDTRWWDYNFGRYGVKIFNPTLCLEIKNRKL